MLHFPEKEIEIEILNMLKEQHKTVSTELEEWIIMMQNSKRKKNYGVWNKWNKSLLHSNI